MAEMDYKQLVQPYVGSIADLQALLFPVRTAAQIGDINDSINTKDKFISRMCWVSDVSGGTAHWATGIAAASTWEPADITVGVTITPS